VIVLNQEAPRNKQGLTEEEFLRQYDAGKYDRPSVTVDMLIFTVTNEVMANNGELTGQALKLLLIKRGDHPFMGQWALPGGFVEIDESLDAAAERELREETGLDRIYPEQLYTWGDVRRDPRTRNISCSYLALVDSAALRVQAGDDAAAAEWFQVRYRVVGKKEILLEQGLAIEKQVELTLTSASETLTALVHVTETTENRRVRMSREVVESPGIAFDHAKIIECAITGLRNKLEYTDIVFNLMPEVFTLSALQQVYEVILGRKLPTAAFRRKMASMVTATGLLSKDTGRRLLKLYRYNSKWRNDMEV
jgi:8-oxo-dGTP diphosphatase